MSLPSGAARFTVSRNLPFRDTRNGWAMVLRLILEFAPNRNAVIPSRYLLVLGSCSRKCSFFNVVTRVDVVDLCSPTCSLISCKLSSLLLKKQRRIAAARETDWIGPFISPASLIGIVQFASLIHTARRFPRKPTLFCDPNRNYYTIAFLPLARGNLQILYYRIVSQILSPACLLFRGIPQAAREPVRSPRHLRGKKGYGKIVLAFAAEAVPQERESRKSPSQSG